MNYETLESANALNRKIDITQNDLTVLQTLLGHRDNPYHPKPTLMLRVQGTEFRMECIDEQYDIYNNILQQLIEFYNNKLNQLQKEFDEL